MPEVINYDPLSPEVMTDPFPTYAKMREKCPVSYFTGLPTPYYVVFRYDDVHEASIDESKYTASLGASPMYREAGSLTNDGAQHMAYRQVVQARFLPRRINQYHDKLENIVAALIDDMLKNGNKSADLVDDFAIPLPVKAASLLLGVSDTPYLEVEQHAYRLLNSAWESESPELYQTYVQEAREFFDHYIDIRYNLIAKAKIDEARPEHVGTVLPDDAISDLVCGKVFGRRLTREEMHQMLQVLLVGGNETTTYLITNCMWRLLEDQQRWQQVKADPEGLIPKAIEESLRYDPPGLGLWRTTKSAIEKHGTTIPANAKVQMSYASANRDPSIFENPDEFRLDRDMLEVRRHMTFGAGAHVCIGQHLSRMEMSITLKAFVERLPNLRLNGEIERVINFGFWGRKKMPIAW